MDGKRLHGGIAAAFLLAVAITLFAMLSTGHATSDGDPYSVPEVVDTNPDPNVVETTITAQQKAVEVGGPIGDASKVNALTYNGTIPGPTFRLKVGDTVIVHFKNDLGKPTGIHWHGIEVANSADGTPFTQNQVEPGGTFVYKFKVNRPGIYWYHPHHHSSTNQVFKGMYGMILVEDPNDAALRASGTLPPLSQTKPLVLSDTTVCNSAGFNPSAVDGQKHAYDDNADTTPGTTGPWVGNAALNQMPKQAPPSPKDLCETSPLNEEGQPGTPFGDGDIPNIQTDTTNLTPANARTNEGTRVLTNGRWVGSRSGGPGPPPGGNDVPGPVLAGATKMDVLAGQGLRLQMLNAAAVRYMRLRLTTATGTLVPLIRVGGEGGLLNTSIQEGGTISLIDTKYTPGEILLPPGSRADVVASIPPGGVGTDLTLWTEDYSRTGNGFSNTPSVPVMHLHVAGSGPVYTLNAGTALRNATGDPVEDLSLLPTNTPLNPATFTPAKKGGVLTAVKLTQDTTNPRGLGVDNTFGTHETPGDYSDAEHLVNSSRYMKEGDVLEYTVENTTNANHPFHLHGFSIQPLQLTVGANTLTYPKEFRDNVDIPPTGKLKFRVRIDPRPLPDGTTPGGALGRWVFHCHIFFHATNGMLSEFVVTNGAGNERPDVNVNRADVSVNQGETATVTGTFKDRDGDPVTLTSSVGTVTKNGANGYTWTYPTGTDSNRLVYITATDSNGLKSQIPFQLNVNDRAPAISVPGAQRVGTGNALSFGVTGSDPDPAGPPSLSAAGLPKAMTFKDDGKGAGTASGRATAAPGTYQATFTAKDGRNLTAQGSVAITIAPFAGVLDNPERMLTRRVRVRVRGRRRTRTTYYINVGCRYYTKSIRSCAASAKRGSKKAGSATAKVKRAGSRAVTFKVTLNAASRRLVAKSLGGVPITVTFTGFKFGSRTRSTAVERTKVVAPSVTAKPAFDAFATGGSKLNARATTYLNSLARTVGKAKRIVCTGHPDSAARALARARAAAACAALRGAGLNAKFSSVGASRPRNKRLTITIQR